MVIKGGQISTKRDSFCYNKLRIFSRQRATTILL